VSASCGVSKLCELFVLELALRAYQQRMVVDETNETTPLTVSLFIIYSYA